MELRSGRRTTAKPSAPLVGGGRRKRRRAGSGVARELRIVRDKVHVFEYDPVAPPALPRWDGDGEVDCKVLQGQNGHVSSVAFSPDGGLLARAAATRLC
jgi:hypothetical protein